MIRIGVTLPGDAEVGDILTITHPDGNVTMVPVTTDMLTNGYPVTYPVPTDETPLTVIATLTDQVGNVSPEGRDSAIVPDIVTVLPDYEVSLGISKGVFINNPGNFDAIIRLSEIDTGVNTGDVVLSINKNNKMILSFDENLTTLGGETLDNAS